MSNSLPCPQQERIYSATGERTDVADLKASSVTAQCFRSAVNSAKVFDQALAPTICQRCGNLLYDSNSREDLAAQVKHDPLPQLFLLFYKIEICTHLLLSSTGKIFRSLDAFGVIDNFRPATFPAEKRELCWKSISDHLPLDPCLIRKCPSLLWVFFSSFLPCMSPRFAKPLSVFLLAMFCVFGHHSWTAGGSSTWRRTASLHVCHAAAPSTQSPANSSTTL